METSTILSIPKFKEDLNKRDFYFNDFKKHLENNKELILSPHGHDFYLCVLFTEGKGIHEIDFKRYEIMPGSSASTQDHRHAPLCCTGQQRGHISYVKVQIEVKPSCTVQCPLWLGFHVAGRVNSFENQS